jgi:hypothetical protein
MRAQLAAMLTPVADMPARARDTRSQAAAWDTLQAALAAAAGSMAAAAVVDFTAVVAADTGKISFNSAEKRPANMPAVSVFGVCGCSR